MRVADLSLTVRQRKLPCVVDPTLALGSARGAELVQRLAGVMEPWLTRSFWQALDASELLLRRVAQGRGTPAVATLLDEAALLEWTRLRAGTDAGSWLLRWVGDCLAESQVQDSADEAVVLRYEALADALNARCGAAAGWPAGYDPVGAALDTLALSATLGGALVLGECTGRGATAEPWPVQSLQRARLQPVRLEPLPADSLFAAERTLLREALAAAGVAPLLEQAHRPLAALHVLVGPLPAAPTDDAEAAADPWDGAQAWWYRV